MTENRRGEIKDIYSHIADEHGMSRDQVVKLEHLIIHGVVGVSKLLRYADPECNVERINEILGVKGEDKGEWSRKKWYPEAIMNAFFYDSALRLDHPDCFRVVLFHPFLSLAFSYITGNSKNAGYIVRDALDSLVMEGINYSRIRSNPERLIEEITTVANEFGIVLDSEDREKLNVAVQKSAKIIDKLTLDLSEGVLDVLSLALSERTNSPLYVLKKNGIDIEPELEEFRQFLAEIIEEKIEPEKLKSLETKKAVEEMPRKAGISENIKLEAQKLLGILNGLKYADYSEKAVEKALKELDAEIKRLIDERNLKLLGLYLGFERLLKNKDFEKAERFLKGLGS